MKNYFIAITLLFVTSSLFITSCKTPEPAKQKTLDKILTSKTIVVGTTGEQFPFSFVDDDNSLKGLDINIANYLAKDLGVEVKYEIMPFDELIPSVLSGKVDIVFSGVSITTERNTKVAFPGVYYKLGKSILTKDQNLAYGEVEVVNKESVTLAVTKSTTSENFVKEKYPNAKLVLTENISDAVKLLDNDEVDGVLSDFETCEIISYSHKKSFLYYKNISKSNQKEFLSPVVAADDYLFINLVSNYIERVNEVNKYEIIDAFWLEFFN